MIRQTFRGRQVPCWPQRRVGWTVCLIALAWTGSCFRYGLATDAVWNGPAGAVWNVNDTRWSTGFFPHNGNGGIAHYDVRIGAPAPTVLNTNVTIDTLTILPDGILNVSN